MNISELAEQYRAQMLRGPNPESAAKGARERRWMNSRVYEVEIARHNELIATIAKNNVALTALGDPAIDIEAVDPLDLNHRAWDDRIAALGRLIWQQTDRLAYLRASAAEAERERMIANETPIQRHDREIAELRAENQALKSSVEQAHRSDSQPRERYVPPAGPLPPMSNAPVTHGTMGFVAAGIVPPAQQHVQGPAARRLGASAKIDDRPAMTHSKREQYGDFSSPADFVKACGR
jgi:hypothetical protein